MFLNIGFNTILLNRNFKSLAQYNIVRHIIPRETEARISKKVIFQEIKKKLYNLERFT